jgi:hypothetical protein
VQQCRESTGHSLAHGLVRSVGVTSTLRTLLSMALKLEKPAATAYHGQPALLAKAPGYGRGAYVIFPRPRRPTRSRPTTQAIST